MSGPAPDDGLGALTAASGTPKAVDVSADRGARRLWPVLLGGPLVWLGHFALTYLVAEAGCTGDGPGLDAFDPPVPRTVTIVATVVALLLCAAVGLWAHRVGQRARAGDAAPLGTLPADAAGTLARIGVLLAGMSGAAVTMVGVMTPLLPGCGA